MTDELNFDESGMEISAAELKRALGIDDDKALANRVLLALDDGNLNWLAEHLADKLTGRILVAMSDGNWNYMSQNLWQPTRLQGAILQWLRNNPTTGIT